MNASTLTVAIRDFGTAKEIARTCACSEATAARYRRGETMPDPVRLARLMAKSMKVASAMLRMAGMDEESMDLEEARLRGELRRLQAKRTGDAQKNSAMEVAPLRQRLAMAQQLSADLQPVGRRASDRAYQPSDADSSVIHDERQKAMGW